MCILLNVKKHEKTFALNVDIFKKRSSMVLLLTSTPPRNTILAYATIGGASNVETSFFLYERI